MLKICLINVFDKFKHHDRYFLNLASSEFPLRTNYELTRILMIYNGSNEIEIIKKISPNRIKYKWYESKEKKKMIMTNTSKPNPPHDYKIVKGYAYCVLSRKFIEYALKDQRAKDLLEWGKDTWSPDEWYVWLVEVCLCSNKANRQLLVYKIWKHSGKPLEKCTKYIFYYSYKHK